MSKSSLLKNILLAGLVAGLLDITAATVILAKGNAMGTLKFVASGFFGAAAFSGGSDMAAWGAVFHFVIAMSFAAGYFLMYPHAPILKKNRWASGVFYGLFVWSVMNLLVVPMTQIPERAFNLTSALKNMAILVVCIGLPVAWLAERFYKTRTA